jgi:hypothetical protein
LFNSFFRRRRKAPRFYQRERIWVAVRNDGKYWAGEYKWQGRTFVPHLKGAYKWGTESACRCAVDSADLFGFVNGKPYTVTVEAVRIS